MIKKNFICFIFIFYLFGCSSPKVIISNPAGTGTDTTLDTNLSAETSWLAKSHVFTNENTFSGNVYIYDNNAIADYALIFFNRHFPAVIDYGGFSYISNLNTFYFQTASPVDGTLIDLFFDVYGNIIINTNLVPDVNGNTDVGSYTKNFDTIHAHKLCDGFNCKTFDAIFSSTSGVTLDTNQLIPASKTFTGDLSVDDMNASGKALFKDINALGDVNSQSKIIAKSFQSTVATGTAPMVVASTTKVTNLNCDLLDGLNTGTSGAAIPQLNATNTWGGTQNFLNVVINGNEDYGAASVTTFGVDTTLNIGTDFWTLSDGYGFDCGTVTGCYLGKAISQKMGFWGVTPISQPTASTDILTGLISSGLRATGSADMNIGTGIFRAKDFNGLQDGNYGRNVKVDGNYMWKTKMGITKTITIADDLATLCTIDINGGIITNTTCT